MNQTKLSKLYEQVIYLKKILPKKDWKIFQRN